MNEEVRSTLGFKSNLQPLGKYGFNDFNFTSKIHDPFALVKLDKSIKAGLISYRLTDMQKNEYENASLHCSYALKDDYPWGTIRENDREKVVCRCVNTVCHRFSVCRPDFDVSELDVLLENEKSHKHNTYDELYSDDESGLSQMINNIWSYSFTETQKQNNQVTEPELTNQQNEPEIIDINYNKPDDSKTSSVVSVLEDFSDDNNKPNNEEFISESKEKKDRVTSFCNIETKNFRSFLAIDQQQIISDDFSKRIIVNAGPGTGKTWTLIERLIDLVTVQHVEPDTIVVLCFSRSAIEVISQRLKAAAKEGRIGLNYDSIGIRTFDSFATHLLAHIKEHESDLLEGSFNLDTLDYDARIRKVTSIIEDNTFILSNCNHLIVDEVQDLVSVRARLVMEMINALPESCGFTLLGDACQSIYDHQVTNGDIDSEQFYRWMFNNLICASFYEFKTNFRQEHDLEALGNNYRKTILTGTDEERRCAASLIYQNIEEMDAVELSELTAQDIASIKGCGKLGILTRQNAEALRISSILRTANIPHKIQRKSTENNVSEWIYRIFSSYRHETINEEDFTSACCSLFPEKEEIKANWDALTKPLNNDKTRHLVSDILKGIKYHAKKNSIFASQDDDIIVSNIHRSKGKEFDSIIILDHLLVYDDGQNKSLQEHKVSYVAVTRAKSKIIKTGMKKLYATSNQGKSRSYKVNKFEGKKPSISYIEVGLYDDLDVKSFVENEDTQSYISQEHIIGERVKLVKNKLINSYIAYDIILEDRPGRICLGRTSKKFYNDMEKIIRNVKKVPYGCEVYKNFYPERLTDIYIDGPTTIIEPIDNIYSGGIHFNDVMIWLGISLVGFAHLEYDRY